MEKTDREIYGLLADVLEYPTSRIVERAKACRTVLDTRNRQAYSGMNRFVEFCGETALGRIEELYTDTFDIEAVCSPYVGYHLFGEDRIRGMFMVRLKGHYALQGHHLRGELPDHIAVMLRSLSLPERSAETGDLIGSCLIPAMEKMISLLKNDMNPYRAVLETALAVLKEEHGS